MSGASPIGIGPRAMNRFFDVDGDVSLQLAPWQLRARNLPINVARFVLREALRYRSDIAGGVIVVPAGYLPISPPSRSLPGPFSWLPTIRASSSAAGCT